MHMCRLHSATPVQTSLSHITLSIIAESSSHFSCRLGRRVRTVCQALPRKRLDIYSRLYLHRGSKGSAGSKQRMARNQLAWGLLLQEWWGLWIAITYKQVVFTDKKGHGFFNESYISTDLSHAVYDFRSITGHKVYKVFSLSQYPDINDVHDLGFSCSDVGFCAGSNQAESMPGDLKT